jgi:hypothetical protein
MSRRPSSVSAGVCAFAAVLFIATAAHSQIAVTTWHYDNARSGANTNETLLTPRSVNYKAFGKLFEQPVDGAIIGQALYLPNVAFQGTGSHNVVYVATMHDSVYAFDADNANGTNATPLWQVSFLSPGVNPVPVTVQGCGTVTKWTEVGVLSTPVIDPASGTLYVVAKTYKNGIHMHQLHALDISTGSEKSGSPVTITASYQSGGKKYLFRDAMQVNRPALLLQNGYLYVAFGSNGCRSSKEEGWVVAYRTDTLQPAGVFDTEPGASAAGIWLRGGGLSADSDGNVYGETADGPYKDGMDFGLSVFKLAQTQGSLALADWFTPYDLVFLDKKDQDLNEPVLLLPDQPGPYPHLAIAVGKEGTLYVLNRDDMGHQCATCKLGDTQIVQELPLVVGPDPGALIYWNNIVYTSGSASPVSAFALADGLLAGVPFAESSRGAGQHSPVLSANGNTSGTIWQINGSTLTAYDALTLERLYSSAQDKTGRDQLPELPHFANLMVANGKVYVGTNTSLAFYGLF